MPNRVSAKCLISLVLLLPAVCFAEEQESLYRARLNVCSLIDAGKFTEAKTATDILIVEFKTYRDLSESLYWIAERYDRQEKYESATGIWQQVINNYPDNPYISKARLSISRANIFSLIVSSKFDDAKGAIEKFIADFAGHPDLPEALYWIAEKYERMDSFENAKQLYQKVEKDYSYNPWANKANLCASRAEIKLLIVSKQYDQAQESIDGFVTVFASSPDLPEALYWITERFEREGRFERAKQNYQRIIQDYSYSSFARKAKLAISKSEVLSLIEAQDFNQADDAMNKMAADFAANPDLAEAFYWIAQRYERLEKLEKAAGIWQQIIKKYQNNLYAGKAKLSISRARIISLIASEKYEDANASLDKFRTDFSDNPDLPEAIFWIAERLQRQDKFTEAKQNYQIIMNNYPDSIWAKKSKLWLSRINVLSLIVSQDYQGAQIALDKFAIDYSSNPDLPEALFWIAERYQRQNRPVEASSIYQKIQQSYPESPFAGKTSIPIAQTAGAVIIEAQNSNGSSINVSMEQQQKAAEIYGLAREYEENSSLSEAKKTYEKIIEQYPGTIKAETAALDIIRMEIQDTLNAGEVNTAEELTDMLVADFNQNLYAIECLNRVAEKSYLASMELKKQKQETQAQDYFTNLEKVLQKAIDGSAKLDTPAKLGKVYYYAAGCRQNQEKWDGAIEYFQKVVNDYPDIERACGAQAAIGWCAEALRDSNQAPKEAINPVIEQAYISVINDYNDCYIAHFAAYRLAEMCVEKGDKTNAIVYYRKFLELARPGNSRINAAKTRIAELGGQR